MHSQATDMEKNDRDGQLQRKEGPSGRDPA
jgi:hypothetical protein